MTNPTKPALDLDALEADVHNHVLSMNGARDIGFGLKIDEVLALIEAARERTQLNKRLTITKAESFAWFNECADLSGNIEQQAAELTTFRAQLAQAREAIDAAQELAEYASYSEMVGGVTVNRPQVRKWCDAVFAANRQTLAAITPAASTEDTP